MPGKIKEVIDSQTPTLCPVFGEAGIWVDLLTQVNFFSFLLSLFFSLLLYNWTSVGQECASVIKCQHVQGPRYNLQYPQTNKIGMQVKESKHSLQQKDFPSTLLCIMTVPEISQHLCIHYLQLLFAMPLFSLTTPLCFELSNRLYVFANGPLISLLLLPHTVTL